MLFDLTYSPLAEFSREHCVAICAFLVPINLLITIQTLVLLALNRLPLQIRRSVGLSMPFALILMLHVGTWLMVGVVHPFTFILLTLATICLTINLGVLVYSEQVRGWILTLLVFLNRFLSVQQMENWLKQEVVR
jgi:hypothetical protein